MSLAVLAQHMASKGRNGDSMLVHMTPGEVHGLHALALAHGGQLTINPETGLPEANFLKKLLPMIAGFALGPAGFGLMSSLGAAATVGGVTALATGSLQKGLMAGLGAYGGAGLAEGLSALGTQEAASKLAEQGIAAGAQENARDALLARAAEQTAIPTGLDALKAGISQAVRDPSSLVGALGGGKQALQYAAMAAAPIMADQSVPTVTKSPGETGYIRPFVYDAATFGQGPQGLQALAPVPANQISYGPPPGGANGGLVALANGGWTGDIPGIGDPRREEFETYFASQMSAKDFAAQQENPRSVLSGDFQAALAGSAASQGEMRRQGIAPITPGSFTTGTLEAASDYLNNINSQRLAGGHLKTDFDWLPLVKDYMAQTLAGNASGAAAAATRLDTIGINFNDPAIRTVISAIDPTFEAKQYYIYHASDKDRALMREGAYSSDMSPATYAGLPTKNIGDFNAVSQLARMFDASGPGWAGVIDLIRTGKVTVEDAAFGLGLDVDAVKQRVDPSYKPATGKPAGIAADGTGLHADGVTSGVYPDTDPNDPRYNQPRQAETAAPETTGIGALIPGTTPGATPGATPGTTAGTATTPGRVIPGTVMGGGVTTPTTATTPTFMLPPGEQIFRTPVGTITGGTVTGAVDTKEALREYERTAPTGRPPEVTALSVLQGYKGTDKTYGGVEKPYAFPAQAQLGIAGAASRGAETMEDVRKAVGDRYAMTASRFEPIVSGASKSAYDYLVGRGEYPTDQRREVDVGPALPLWRPYVQGAAGAAPTGYVPATGAPAAQFGFKPVTGTTLITGTQRWKNTKTGEIYLAPAGYAPPSNDWVLDTQAFGNPDIDGAGVGDGSGNATGPGGDGFGGGESAKAGGLMRLAMGGYAQGGYNLGSYSDGGRLLRGPGDGVSDSIPATIGAGQPARLADGEFVVPARIVSELGNGSTEAGARKLYAMMDRVQRARRKTTGKNKVAANTKAERFLPA